MQGQSKKRKYEKPKLVRHGGILALTHDRGGGKGKNPVHDAFGSRGGIT